MLADGSHVAVVLPVDVGRDRAADRDVACCGQHGKSPPERQQVLEQRGERDAALRIDDLALRVEAQQLLQGRAVEHDAVAVQRGISVASSETAGDDTARPRGGECRGDRVGGSNASNRGATPYDTRVSDKRLDVFGSATSNGVTRSRESGTHRLADHSGRSPRS